MYLDKFGGTVKLAVAGFTLAAMTAGAAFAQDAVTLKWALWDWDKTAYYKPLIEAYQAKHPNVKFEPMDLGSQDYQQMISTQLTGGSKDIDIVTIKDVPGYTNLVRAGNIADLSGFVKDQKIELGPLWRPDRGTDHRWQDLLPAVPLRLLGRLLQQGYIRQSRRPLPHQ